MPRRVVAHRSSETFDLVEVPVPNEHHLQEVVRAPPQLIPAEDLGLDGDLLVVGRETTLASAAIDLLCLARSGDLVLVEFKTGPQNPDFRHALAQVVDYGSDLWRLSYEDFDRGVVQRYLSRYQVAGEAPLADLDEAISHAGWNLSDDERKALRSRGLDLTAHAAQVVAAPPPRAVTPSGSSTQSNETGFLAAIPEDGYRDGMADIFAACATLDLAVQWQSKGASIRIQTPDCAEPLSIGWGLSGRRHMERGQVSHARSRSRFP